MKIQEAIRTRRAVKHYEPTHTITAAEEEELFDLAAQSPSSFNIQHWRIVNVKDKAIREEIKAAAWGQAQVTDASMLLVLCADVQAWDKNPERYWENAPKEVRDYLLPMIGPFYEGKEQLQRDEALRSVGIIAQTIMLAARGMGYDSCPMIGFDADAVAKIINLPDDHLVGMLITIGKAAKPANAKGGHLPRGEVVKVDRF